MNKTEKARIYDELQELKKEANTAMDDCMSGYEAVRDFRDRVCDLLDSFEILDD